MKSSILIATLILLHFFEISCLPSDVEKDSTQTQSAGINFILPSSAFFDRTATVQIGGVNTHFSQSTAIDFGDPNIGSEVISVSNLNIVLKVDVRAGASLGLHDITLKTNEEVVTGRGIFETKSSLQLADGIAKEALNQGALADISMLNLDYIDNPFNAGNMGVVEGPRLLRLNGVSSSKFSWLGLLDISDRDYKLHSKLRSISPLGKLITYDFIPGADSLTIRSATPVVLRVGQAMMQQSLPTSYASNIYRIDGTERGSILRMAFSNVGSDLRDVGPTVAIAPGNGKFGDGQVVTNPSGTASQLSSLVFVQDPGTVYVAVFAGDYSGKVHGYEYDLSVSKRQASIKDLAEPVVPDAPNKPIADISLETSMVGINGKIDVLGDNDFVRFLAIEDGKVFAQAAGTPALAMRLAYFESDCITPMVGIPSKPFQQEADIQAGKTYCLRLSANVITPYRLLITSAPTH